MLLELFLSVSCLWHNGEIISVSHLSVVLILRLIAVGPEASAKLLASCNKVLIVLLKAAPLRPLYILLIRVQNNTFYMLNTL